MNDRAVPTNGIGVCSALGIAFVVLKLCGVIGWSWWWVLAPFWIPPAVVIVVIAVIFSGRAGWQSLTRGNSSSQGSP